MAHKRQFVVQSEDIIALLAGIGCALSTTPINNADIEYTLYKASEESITTLDFRILGLIVQWVEVHEFCINQPRLLRFILQTNSYQSRVFLFWKAIAQWRKNNRKWSAFMKEKNSTERFDLLPVGTDFQIQRKGEDPRFVGTILRIPMGLLRVRNGDIFHKEQMVQIHKTYENRVRFGVCLRADLWSFLEQDDQISSSQLAKFVGCAFSSAWEVKQDYHLWKQSVP
jgi:hypothetical protein